MTLRVDQTAIKVNQATIVALLILAFVLDSAPLMAFVAAVMAVGTVWPEAGLFKAVYLRGLRPLGLLRPDPRPDDPAAHLFAQGVGATCLVVGLVLLAVGLPVAGWAFGLLVIALASVNLVSGFCVGCFLYYQLARRQLIGHRQQVR
jgi:hypothetical protein